MRNILLSLFLLLSFFACKEDNKSSDIFVLSTQEVKYDSDDTKSLSFSASIMLKNEESVEEEGFVYGLKNDATLEDDLVLLVEEPDENNFSVQVENALVPDTTYYVRSFLKTETLLIYGNEVEFYSNGSNPPVLDALEPDSAFWGDTIMIIGENFDYTGEKNKVYFGDLESEDVWGNDDTIYAVVPDSLNSKTCDLSLRLYGQVSDNSKAFHFCTPVIDSMSTKEGQYPDTVSVFGDYFSEDYCQLLFADKLIAPVEISRNKLKFVVPFLGDAQKVNVEISQLGEQVNVMDDFTYNEQAVKGVINDPIYYGDEVSVYAENIDFRKLQFEVIIDDRTLSASYVTGYKDSISFLPSIGWYDLVENNDFEIKILDNEDTIYSKVLNFSFLSPELEMVDSVTCINGSINLKMKGLTSYSSFTCYYSGEMDTVIKQGVAKTNGDIRIIKVPYQIPPGEYQLYVKDGIGITNTVQFTIKEPELLNVDPYSFDRSSETFLMEGNYLPKRRNSKWRGWSARNTETGMTYKIYGDGSNNFDVNYLMCSGVYDLIFENDYYTKEFDNALQFNDAFTLVKQLDSSPSLSSYSQGAKISNTVYVYDKGRTSIIDLTAGDIEEHYYGYWNSGWHKPYYVMYEDEMYAIYDGGLKKYTENNGREDVDVADDADDINLAFVVGNELWCVDDSNKVYVKNSSGDFEYLKRDDVFDGYLFAVCKDDKLYLFSYSSVKIFDIQSFEEIEEIAYNVDFGSLNLRYLEFYLMGDKVMFYSMLNSYFYFFDLESNEVISSDVYKFPENLPTVIYGDDEEMYILYKDAVYKYN